MANFKRIWLIDDDEDESFIFETALGELGHAIEFWYERDSQIALVKFYNGDTPDLLFLDWNMPRCSGLEVLTAIRKIPGFDTIPIIIYSTANTNTDKDKAMQLGASYYLSKQSTIGDLREKLLHILSLDWTVKI